jgi:hypothetical protein
MVSVLASSVDKMYPFTCQNQLHVCKKGNASGQKPFKRETDKALKNPNNVDP